MGVCLKKKKKIRLMKVFSGYFTSTFYDFKYTFDCYNKSCIVKYFKYQGITVKFNSNIIRLKLLIKLEMFIDMWDVSGHYGFSSRLVSLFKILGLPWSDKLSISCFSYLE